MSIRSNTLASKFTAYILIKIISHLH
jgi:hypothetical protein